MTRIVKLIIIAPENVPLSYVERIAKAEGFSTLKTTGDGVGQCYDHVNKVNRFEFEKEEK